MITYTYKVVLLGNCYVGKTTFFKKVKGNIEFPVSDAGRHSDSLDMASCILEIRLPGSPTSRILLELYDTGSVERFRNSIPTNYFRYCHCVLLMYDLTDPTSLYDLEDWMTDAYNKTSDEISITFALVGNKLDDVEASMDITQGEHFAERHGIPKDLQFMISVNKESTESLRAIFKTIALSIHDTQIKGGSETQSEGISLIHDSVIDNEGTCSKC